jgi:hypothetical protein
MNQHPTHPHPARKKATTFRLDADLVDSFRSFCRFHAGSPFYLSSISGFVEAAIAAHLAAMRRRVEGDVTINAAKDRDRHAL